MFIFEPKGIIKYNDRLVFISILNLNIQIHLMKYKPSLDSTD